MHDDDFGKMFVLLMLIGAFMVIPAILVRYGKQRMLHRERMIALEKGLELPSDNGQTPVNELQLYLLRGLLWLFGGIALSVFLLALGGTVVKDSTAGRLLIAQNLRARGATPEQVDSFLWHAAEPHTVMPESFAFAGLIPISIGVAYLIFYGLERRNALLIRS